MIISHERQFIFVKSKKTAGSSLEIALTPLLGPNDTLTTTGREDEARMGHGGSRNDLLPLRCLTVRDAARWARRRRRPRFNSHQLAREIRHYVGDEVWRSYFTFAVERNPFDKAISAYHFAHGHGWTDLPIDPWVAQHRTELSNWDFYADDDGPIVDFVGSYDSLGASLAVISGAIGSEVTMPAERAKGQYRTDHRPPSEVLNPESVAIIRQECRREIDLFAYGLT